MIETKTLSLSEIEDLSLRALMAAGTSEQNARPLAVATAATEADGVASHGLAYIPIYCEHVQCGKVDGQAVIPSEQGFANLPGTSPQYQVAASRIDQINLGVIQIEAGAD